MESLLEAARFDRPTDHHDLVARCKSHTEIASSDVCEDFCNALSHHHQYTHNVSCSLRAVAILTNALMESGLSARELLFAAKTRLGLGMEKPSLNVPKYIECCVQCLSRLRCSVRPMKAAVEDNLHETVRHVLAQMEGFTENNGAVGTILSFISEPCWSAPAGQCDSRIWQARVCTAIELLWSTSLVGSKGVGVEGQAIRSACIRVVQRRLGFDLPRALSVFNAAARGHALPSAHDGDGLDQPYLAIGRAVYPCEAEEAYMSDDEHGAPDNAFAAAGRVAASVAQRKLSLLLLCCALEMQGAQSDVRCVLDPLVHSTPCQHTAAPTLATESTSAPSEPSLLIAAAISLEPDLQESDCPAPAPVSGTVSVGGSGDVHLEEILPHVVVLVHAGASACAEHAQTGDPFAHYDEGEGGMDEALTGGMATVAAQHAIFAVQVLLACMGQVSYVLAGETSPGEEGGGGSLESTLLQGLLLLIMHMPASMLSAPASTNSVTRPLEGMPLSASRAHLLSANTTGNGSTTEAMDPRSLCFLAVHRFLSVCAPNYRLQLTRTLLLSCPYPAMQAQLLDRVRIDVAQASRAAACSPYTGPEVGWLVDAVLLARIDEGLLRPRYWPGVSERMSTDLAAVPCLEQNEMHASPHRSAMVDTDARVCERVLQSCAPHLAAHAEVDTALLSLLRTLQTVTAADTSHPVYTLERWCAIESEYMGPLHAQITFVQRLLRIRAGVAEFHPHATPLAGADASRVDPSSVYAARAQFGQPVEIEPGAECLKYLSVTLLYEAALLPAIDGLPHMVRPPPMTVMTA